MKRFLYCLAAGLLFCGCVREEISSSRMALGKREEKSYAPVEKAKLSLEMSRERTLAAGGSGELTFVLVKEWYSNEPDNIISSCQNFLPGMTSYDPDPAAWVRLTAPVRKPAWRYPLKLTPGNRVVISKQLEFIRNLAVSPGSERRYFVRAELNLTSVKVASKVFTISVRNPEDLRKAAAPSPGNAPAGESRHFNR